MSDQTVDMVLAIQHRKPKTDFDLRASVRELAQIVGKLTVVVAAMAIADGASSTRLAELGEMRDAAHEIAERLS